MATSDSFMTLDELNNHPPPQEWLDDIKNENMNIKVGDRFDVKTNAVAIRIKKITKHFVTIEVFRFDDSVFCHDFRLKIKSDDNGKYIIAPSRSWDNPLRNNILGKSKCYFGTDLKYIEKNMTTEGYFRYKSLKEGANYDCLCRWWNEFYNKRFKNKEYRDAGMKIANWFLKCKYDPELKYCKKWLNDEYDNY